MGFELSINWSTSDLDPNTFPRAQTISPIEAFYIFGFLCEITRKLRKKFFLEQLLVKMLYWNYVKLLMHGPHTELIALLVLWFGSLNSI